MQEDFKSQIGTVKKQLHEVQETRSKGDDKISKVVSNLRTLQEEKGSLEIKLGQKEKALQAQVWKQILMQLLLQIAHVSSSLKVFEKQIFSH